MSPAETTETVQIGSIVTADLANQMKALAERSERSVAAEIRLALRAWVDAARLEQSA